MSHTPVRSGLPSGRRGTCAESATAGAGLATRPDCAKLTLDPNENSANAKAEIKYVWKWFFTWKPSQTGLDGAGSLRVLLYHCEIHAFPFRNFLRRRHSLRSEQRLAAVRAAL